MYPSFSNIVKKCLNDITLSINEYNHQTMVIHDNINIIEQYIQNYRYSRQVHYLLKKYKQLSSKNNHLQQQQSSLTAYYHQLLALVSTTTHKTSPDLEKAQKEKILKNLIKFYTEHNHREKAIKLNQYICTL